MSARPRAAPTLLASVVATVPARLVKKLDQSPRAADAWTFAGDETSLTVTTDGGETVRLVVTGGVVASIEGGGCTCLLSPRCFHLLAVVAALDIADAEGEETHAPGVPSSPPVKREEATVSEEQRTAAKAAWEAAARVVAGGANAAGAVVLGEILRASHTARASGLHRIAGGGVRVVAAVRALGEERPEFALGELSADLEDLLASAWAVAHAGSSIEPEWLGVARRAYEPIGGLRVTGLFTEAVVRGAYAGVVSYVSDERGRVYTLNDVLPADVGRARSAYDAAVRVGDTSVSHRRLVREGLFMQDATASADMRLGAGANVKAVRAAPGALDSTTAATLWDAPLAAQVARAYGALEVPLAERPAAATLVFARGTVLGHDDTALLLGIERAGRAPMVLRVVAPSDHAELSYRDNLRLLAGAPGLRLRIAGHIVPDRPRTLAGVAVLAAEPDDLTDAPRLSLPEEWAGRVCLGLDPLQAAHVVGATAPGAATRSAESVLDPLAPLRRRIRRMALGGRETIRPAAMPEIERERTTLEKRHMGSAGAVLDALARAALRKDADVAVAWLRAAVFDGAATRALQQRAWGA